MGVFAKWVQRLLSPRSRVTPTAGAATRSVAPRRNQVLQVGGSATVSIRLQARGLSRVMAGVDRVDRRPAYAQRLLGSTAATCAGTIKSHDRPPGSHSMCSSTTAQWRIRLRANEIEVRAGWVSEPLRDLRPLADLLHQFVRPQTIKAAGSAKPPLGYRPLPASHRTGHHQPHCRDSPRSCPVRRAGTCRMGHGCELSRGSARPCPARRGSGCRAGRRGVSGVLWPGRVVTLNCHIQAYLAIDSRCMRR